MRTKAVVTLLMGAMVLVEGLSLQPEILLKIRIIARPVAFYRIAIVYSFL